MPGKCYKEKQDDYHFPPVEKGWVKRVVLF